MGERFDWIDGGVFLKKIDNHALEGIIMEDMHIVMITIVVISAFLLI